MKEKSVVLKSDQPYMTLQALLQVADIIPTGGMAKAYLQDNVVIVNGESENRRGRKLYPDDVIQVSGNTYLIKKQ